MITRKALLASLVFFPGFGHCAGLFTGFHSFGDSLTDSGNVYNLSGGTIGYPGGRFSNGPTWAEQLATDFLGFPAHPPLILGGTNHAWGGARTANIIPPLGESLLPPSIKQQVDFFLEDGGSFSSGDLVSLWGGANDLIDSIESDLGIADPMASAANLGSALDSVLGAGAETVLILNLPDLGATPAFRGGPSEALASAWTVDFNAALAAQVEARRVPGLALLETDIFSLGIDFQDNPSTYGLDNLFDPVFPDRILDPSTSAFWDDVHPTETVHGIFAREAANTLGIPEPSSVLLMLTAPLFLIGRRRS